jgi:hypothetical protein
MVFERPPTPVAGHVCETRMKLSGFRTRLSVIATGFFQNSDSLTARTQLAEPLERSVSCTDKRAWAGRVLAECTADTHGTCSPCRLSTLVPHGGRRRKLSSSNDQIGRQQLNTKVLRIFAWSWVLSALAISVFAKTFDPYRGHAFIAAILGVIPAGLVTLACFVVQAVDESIESRFAAVLAWRGESVSTGDLCPSENPEVAESITGSIDLPNRYSKTVFPRGSQTLVVRSLTLKPMRSESAERP